VVREVVFWALLEYLHLGLLMVMTLGSLVRRTLPQVGRQVSTQVPSIPTSADHSQVLDKGRVISSLLSVFPSAHSGLLLLLFPGQPF
jgi:hypothetical protein